MTQNRLLSQISDADHNPDHGTFGIAAGKMEARRVGTPTDGFSRLAVRLANGEWWWAEGTIVEAPDYSRLMWNDGSEIAPP